MTKLELDFDKQGGLMPVIVTEYGTGDVLMLAYMNQESYQRTLETGQMWYWSRSRRELWHKGATSGHFQTVRSITADCDLDTLLIAVDQIGAACHTGRHSCFFNKIERENTDD
ncbi:MAG: phosphoribosyl-AMP cyclohydrolase [Streptococcaceae bacterium]|jgi:phosphoribosyl-AMP cyclohydrolase|nr:phosphoribosyl-AMP cyclohydrolase [Streptococcaceae bacterium]